MSERVYEFASGARISGKLDAQEVGEAIERLGGLGVAAAEDIWQAARDEASPMHPHFTWDPAIGMPKLWRQEARQLTNSLRVYQRGTDGEQRPVPAFVSVTRSDGERGYRPYAFVLSVEDERAQFVDDGFHALASFRLRYGDLPEFASVMKAIEALIRRHQREAA